MLPCMRADFIDGNNSGMLQSRSRFGFGFETFDVVLGRQMSGENHFDGHNSVQTLLPGFVDDPHPTTAEFLQDLVVGNDLPDHFILLG